MAGVVEVVGRDRLMRKVSGIVYKRFLIHRPILALSAMLYECTVSNAAGCSVHLPFFSQKRAKEFINEVIAALEPDDLEYMLTVHSDNVKPRSKQWRRISKTMRAVKDRYKEEEP